MIASRESYHSIDSPDANPIQPESREESLENIKNLKQYRTRIILLCFTYFIFGSSLGIYGALYPSEATSRGIVSVLYASVLGISSLTAILFYPVACYMVSTTQNCKFNLFSGLFLLGVCRTLFGVLSLIPEKRLFISLSYSIQIVDGIGLSILIASSLAIAFYDNIAKLETKVKRWMILLTFLIGTCIGPICSRAIIQVFDCGVPFYAIGILTLLNALVVVLVLPETDFQLANRNLPVMSWFKNKRMIIYFIIIITVFNYVGFISAILIPFITQLHLDSLLVGLVFSIPCLLFTLSAPGWIFMRKKGFNSVLLASIGCLLIFVSLIYLGPVPFANMQISIRNICIALGLQGIGNSGKVIGALLSADKDIKMDRKRGESHDPLIVPTLAALGSLLGFFTGSVIAGFSYSYLGLPNATYIFLSIEVLTFAISVVFAFKRNYRSRRHSFPATPE